MKKFLSLFLVIASILSTLAFAVSCVDEDTLEADGTQNSSGNASASQNGTLSAGNSDTRPPVFITNNNSSTSSVMNTSAALLSSVRVIAHFERYLGYGAGLSKIQKESAGVIYRINRSSGDAYIITNFSTVYLKDAVSPNHVSDNIEIFLYGQESESYSVKATYIGGSLAGEIAVLKVTGSEVIKRSHAIPVEIADSNNLHIFDEVFAIDNPGDKGLSAMTGIVSLENDIISMLGADGKTTVNLRTIRTNTVFGENSDPYNPPGGGLFDKSGNLVGISIPKKTSDNTDNMAYAIPSNIAKGIADILIESYTGSVTVGYKKYDLGIKMENVASGVIIDSTTGEVIKISEVGISEIASSSPLASVAEVGDIITEISVDGEAVSVNAMHIVIEQMLKAKAGSTVKLTLLRADEVFEKTITITKDMLLLVA